MGEVPAQFFNEWRGEYHVAEEGGLYDEDAPHGAKIEKSGRADGTPAFLKRHFPYNSLLRFQSFQEGIEVGDILMYFAIHDRYGHADAATFEARFFELAPHDARITLVAGDVIILEANVVFIEEFATIFRTHASVLREKDNAFGHVVGGGWGRGHRPLWCAVGNGLWGRLRGGLGLAVSLGLWCAAGNGL